MFAGCLQIMRAHSHLIRVEGIGYSQIIRAENTDVCSSYGLCLQAATGNSLKEVADVLHHRSLNTSLIYAKLDSRRLLAVALPWPGSES